MKLITSVFIFLTLLIVGVYTLLFTSLGHGFLVPIIENNIKQNTKIDNVIVKSFSLKPDQLDIVVDMDTNIIKFDATFNIFDRVIVGNYIFDIKELSSFSQVLKKELSGSFFTNGTVSGEFDNLDVKGLAKVAKGDIDYACNIKNDINDISFDGKEIDLETLLLMIGEKQYASGSININGSIKSLSSLNGDIKTQLNDGVLNHILIEKDFALSLPKNLPFILEVDSKLSKKSIQNKIKLDSFLATVTSKNSEFFMETKKLQSDYKLVVSDLSKLYFLTKQKMRGDIEIDGDITFDKKLLATFHSKKFEGIIDGKLDGDKIEVNGKNLQTLDLLHMLYYPEVFHSSLDGDISFDLRTKKGKSLVNMYEGQFLTNEAMSKLKNLTSYDLTLEIYEKSTLTTQIDNTILDNTLLMKSKNSTIKSDNMLIDTNSSTINADIDLLYKKTALGVNLDGDISGPNIKVKVDDALKEKVIDKGKKELDRFIEKNIDDSSKESFKGLIKGLFN